MHGENLKLIPKYVFVCVCVCVKEEEANLTHVHIFILRITCVSRLLP